MCCHVLSVITWRRQFSVGWVWWDGYSETQTSGNEKASLCLEENKRRWLAEGGGGGRILGKNRTKAAFMSCDTAVQPQCSDGKTVMAA